MLSWPPTVIGIVLVVGLLVLGSFAIGGHSAAPWLPLWRRDVRRMLTLARIQPGELLVDLGAGDGRIVVMAAEEFGAKAIGYEIAYLPYFYARFIIVVRNLRGKATVQCKNFFKVQLDQADIVCAFLTPDGMAKLKPKLEKEIKPGARVVSYAFPIPGWEPVVRDKPTEKQTAIYLYQR